jgi:predicted ATPase/DNA-binding CsgD family transcriptional regulator
MALSLPSALKQSLRDHLNQSKMDNHELHSDEIHVDDLTWRELDILNLLAQHLTNREIADHLHLAESTVKDYVGKILSKLYVKNRRQAVERAKALGLLDADKQIKIRPLTNLPAESTPFVGRKDELAEIKQYLTKTRLLTLTGPGGIGKTRLAVKAATEAADDFEDGRFFVSLAPIRSSDHIIQTIAEAVKFPLATHENPQQQLLRYLQKRQLLLVMDNFEHLLEGVGIVSEILQAAPEVKILATSRERLNLQSETILNVDGMAFPDPTGSKDILNYDAINLFVQSARKVRPEFDPSRDHIEQIIKICQIVEGMPLAIELAAAWLQILKVHEIVEELEKGLDILSTEARDAPKRHRSIHAVFNQSWSMLDPSEQEIFKCLSVFRGGFTREAAQKVSGASLQQLAGLVNKSFLSHDLDTGRFEVHELLRQYAQKQLGETPGVSVSAHEAHAAFFAAFMQEGWEDLKGGRQMHALTEIEADIENVRAAWRYDLDQRNVPQMWKFIKGLWRLYWIRWWNHAGMELFAEAARVLQQGEQDEEAVTLGALAMAYQGHFMAWLGLADQGYELAKKSVDILQQLNHPEALFFAYYGVCLNAYFLYRLKQWSNVVNKMLEIVIKIEDKWLFAFAQFPAGWVALFKEDFAEARQIAESNLNICEEIGDMIGSTTPLIILGHAALACGEHEEARKYYLRCVKVSEETGFYFSLQTSSKYLGKVSTSLGRFAEAEKYLRQSLTIAKEIGFVRDVINLIYEFARLQVAQENPEYAVELLALVIQHPDSNQMRWLEGSIRDNANELLSKLEDELSLEIFTAAMERGQELELDMVVTDLVGPNQRK